MKTKIFLLFALLFSFTNVFAHPLIGESSGFFSGFFHPISGLDHILAMLAVGIWAAQTGGKARWIIPVSFVGLMTLGSFIGINNINLPFAEIGVLVSVVVLGIFILAGIRFPIFISSVIVGIFALCHGHTHGTEIPATASGLTYIIGFVLTTVFLHLLGISFGQTANRFSNEKLIKFSGAAIAFTGMFFTYNYFISY